MRTIPLPSTAEAAAAFRRRRALLVLPVILVAAACQCSPKVTGNVTGVIMLDPAGKPTQFERSIDFGGVRLSEVATHPIVLQNNGRETVTITAKLETPTPALFYLQMPEGDGYTVTMQPSQTLTMQLRYLPVMIGANTATVIITTTAPLTPKYTVDVTGAGARSQIDVCSTDANGAAICASTSPSGILTIDMGAVVPGSTSTKPLIIKDLGGLDLDVSSVAPTANTSTEFGVGPDHGPLTVKANGSSQYQVTYAPLYGGPETGVIEILSDDPTQPDLLVHINGQGNAPQLCFTPAPPSPVDFGPVTVNTTAHQPLIITSCGSQPATITQFVLDKGENSMNSPANVFNATNLPTGSVTLNPNDMLTLDMTFDPTALGPYTGKLTIVFTTNQGSVHGSIPLTGSGVGCALSAPPLVNFGEVPNNGMASQIITAMNNGLGDCTIAMATISGAPFTLPTPPTVPITVPSGMAATFTVTFSPTTLGQALGSLVLSSDALSGPTTTIDLRGTAITPPPCAFVASPSTITFTGVSTGQSAMQSVTLTNEGTDTCDIVNTQVDPVTTGQSVADFTTALSGAAVTGPPGLAPVSLSPGMSVTLTVTFKPTVTTPQTVNVEVDYCDDNSTNPFCMECTILGNCPSVAQNVKIPVNAQSLVPQICVMPASLDFGSVAPGQTKDMPFIITSCGQGSLDIRGVKFEAGSSARFTILSNIAVPQFLPPGNSIQVNVQYKPQSSAGDFGQVAVLSNDPATPKKLVPVHGNVATICDKQLACNTDKLIFPTLQIGQQSSLALVCTDVGDQPVTITGVSFSPQTSTDYTGQVAQPPVVVQPGQTVRVVVTYTPTTAGTSDGAVLIASDACQQASANLEATSELAAYPPCLPPQQFSPQVKWNWTGQGAVQPQNNDVAMSPIVVNLTDDNGDGRVDVNDIPEVLFTSCASTTCCVNCLNPSDFSMTDFAGIGMLRAIHGKDGSPYFDITAPNLQLFSESQIATADLDGDGLPEIIAAQHSFHPGTGMASMAGKYISGALLVFDHTGRLEFQTDNWTGDPNNFEFGSAPAIADLDGDGNPEIIFERTVFNYDGTKKFDMAASGAWGHGSFPTIVDLNGDGKPEIISGAYVYEPDGTLLWMAPGSGATCDPTQTINACATSGGMCDPVSKKCIMYSGPTMVVGLHLNGRTNPATAVVVLRDGAQSLHVLNGADGHVLASATWSPPSTNSNDPTEQSNGICPAPSSAADLDGDGDAEFIIPAGDYIYVWKYNGTQNLTMLWNYPIQDYDGQCGASGSAAFDFNGNGQYDVVYHDTQYMYVFQGNTGQLVYQAPRSSYTIFETPVIADVDNDGHADLIMTNATSEIPGLTGGLNGVVALSNTGNNWPSTRRIWSDHNYHISEITDDATIPLPEPPSWKLYNNWRAQVPLCTPSGH